MKPRIWSVLAGLAVIAAASAQSQETVASSTPAAKATVPMEKLWRIETSGIGG